MRGKRRLLILGVGLVLGSLALACMVEPSVLAPPANLVRTASTEDPRTVTLSWDDNSNNETGFSVEKSNDGGVNWSVAVTVSANTASATIALGETEGFPYFRVQALEVSLEAPVEFASEYSNVISIEGTDPTVADTDGDGMLDGFEVAHGLDPCVDDAYEDADGDRYPNIFEYARGSDVNDAGSVPAADYIADGSNPPSGNSFSTIQTALDQVTENHRIVQVREGTYSGSGNVNLTVSATHSLLLIGEKGAGGTILDGGGTSRLLTTQGQTVVDGFTFRNGAGGEGGALYAGGGNLLVVNCVFSGNQAIQNGGALYQAAGSTMVIHSTFLNNLAGGEGAAAYVEGGYLGIAKSILWNPGTAAEVAMSGTGASVEITESIIRGGFAGTGNLSVDPLARPEGHLTVSSPAIDSGGILLTALLDMDGEERPAGSTTDIGADEWVDADADGLPDWWELDVFGSLTAAGSDDPDGDGLTNVQEYQQGGDPQDYFSQGGTVISPTLSIVGGNNQTGDPSTFANEPFVVEMRSGTAVLGNAPMTFAVTGSGGGGIATENDGPEPVSTLSVVTGSDGRAQVFFEYPATFATSSTVAALAGSGTSASQVSFQAETSLIPQSGLALWLRADAGVTMGTSGKISAWADQSDFNNNAAQSTSNRQPLLVDGAVNGHPSVRFSGGQGMAISDNESLRPESFTAMAVLKQNGLSSYQRLLCRMYHPGSTWMEPFLSYALGTIAGNQDSFPRVSVATGGTFKSVAGQAGFDSNKFHLLGWRYDMNSQSVYREGVLLASGSASGPISYGGATVVTLGMRNAAPTEEFLKADVAELIFYSRSLSGEEQRLVEAYLAQKYALEIDDFDSDGMPNAYEVANGLNPLVDDAAGDLDQDGWSNGQEYGEGSDPNDYYDRPGSTIVPTISIVSGDEQSGGNSLLAPAPLVIEVLHEGRALANAPLKISVSGSAGGWVAASPSGAAMGSSLDIRSGPDGRAKIYLQFPSDFPAEAVMRIATPDGSREILARMMANESAVPGIGLSLWLRADKGVVKGEDGKVSGWEDQSGLENDATTGIEARKPQFVESFINGRPALKFSGAQCLAIVDSVSLRPEFLTVLAVVRQKSGTQFQRLINRPYYPPGHQWVEPYTSYAFATIGENLTNSPRMSVAAAGVLNIANGSGGVALNANRLLGWKYDGISQRVYSGGNLVGSGTASGAIAYGSATEVVLGARNGTGVEGFLNGDVAEILFYGRALSAEEQREAEAYLAQKYGMTEYDSDGDGLSDGYEAAHGLNPLVSDSETDSDGDGLTNLQEYQAGSDPGDYYNGQVAVLSIAGGNNQEGPEGQLLPNPLTVEVTNQQGGLLLNAPVRFRVVGGEGKITTGGGAGLGSVQEVRTGTGGRASLYLVPGGAVGTLNQVEVSTITQGVSASVVFEATVTETALQKPGIRFQGGYQMTTVPAGESIGFPVAVEDPDARAVKVELYAGGEKVGESLVAPYTITWTPSAAGRFPMTVKIFDGNGQTAADSRMLNVVGAASESEAYSPVGGGMAATLPSDSDTIAALPFHRPAVFAGRIKEASGNTLEAEAGTSWAPGRFIPAETAYAVRILSGAREGEELLIAGNTGTILQLQESGSTPPPEAGAKFQIVPVWRADDALGANIFGSSVEDGQVELKIPDLEGEGIERPYARTWVRTSSGWREGLVENPFLPSSWFVVRNQAAANLAWTPIGDVLNASVRIPVGKELSGANDTPVAFPRPSVFSPVAAGLMSGGVLGESEGIGEPGDRLLGFSAPSGPIGRGPDVILYRVHGHLYRLGGEMTDGDLSAEDIFDGGSGWYLRRSGSPEVLINHAGHTRP